MSLSGLLTIIADDPQLRSALEAAGGEAGHPVSPGAAGADLIGPPALHVPVPGLYLSVEVSAASTPFLIPRPPATSTTPLTSVVAVWKARAWCSEPVRLHVPADGL